MVYGLLAAQKQIKSTAVLLISHSLREVRRVSDKVGFMLEANFSVLDDKKNLMKNRYRLEIFLLEIDIEKVKSLLEKIESVLDRKIDMKRVKGEIFEVFFRSELSYTRLSRRLKLMEFGRFELFHQSLDDIFEACKKCSQ